MRLIMTLLHVSYGPGLLRWRFTIDINGDEPTNEMKCIHLVSTVLAPDLSEWTACRGWWSRADLSARRSATSCRYRRSLKTIQRATSVTTVSLRLLTCPHPRSGPQEFITIPDLVVRGWKSRSP